MNGRKRWYCKREDCEAPANLTELLNGHRSDLTTGLSALNTTVSSLTSTVKDIEGSVKFLSDQYGILQLDVDALKKSKLENVSELKADVGSCKDQVVELQQYLRIDNIIITGVPEEKGEKLFGRMAGIAAALDVTVADCDISAIHRLPSHKAHPARPRNIVAKLTTRWKKNEHF